MGIYKVRGLYTIRLVTYRNVILIRVGGMATAHSTQRKIKNAYLNGRMVSNMVK